MRGKFRNRRIGFHCALCNGCHQHHALEGFATAQGDVDLTVRKGGIGVNDGAFKGQSLALVNGDRPGQPQWILGKSPNHLRCNLLGFRIQGVFYIFPGNRLDRNLCLIIGAFHADTLLVDMNDLSDLAIEIEFFRRAVVAHEHDLCALFQR